MSSHWTPAPLRVRVWDGRGMHETAELAQQDPDGEVVVTSLSDVGFDPDGTLVPAGRNAYIANQWLDREAVRLRYEMGTGEHAERYVFRMAGDPAVGQPVLAE